MEQRVSAHRVFPFLLFIFTIASLVSITLSFHPFSQQPGLFAAYMHRPQPHDARCADADKHDEQKGTTPDGVAEGAKSAYLELELKVVLTIGAAVAALFVILTKWYGPQEKHWAFGTLGLLLGYWLR
jgi:hypothetical protein